MVLNGAAVVERAIRPLLEVVDEICLVDTGSTDGTMQVVGRLVEGKKFNFALINPDGDNYFPDAAESFRRTVPGPFTGRPLLRDWSMPRNLGLDLCTGQYVLKLDADDQCMDPGKVVQALDYLDACPEVDMLACPYEVMDSTTQKLDHVTMYTRIWRNKSEIRFREVLHENVDYLRLSDGSNWRIVEGGLVFRDWRDSPGEGVRVAHRNYKVLLREYERLEEVGVQPSPHLLVYLAQEAIRVDPRFSLDLCHKLLDTYQLLDGDRSWVATIVGESCELCGEDEAAVRSYDIASSLGSQRATLLSAMLKARRQISLRGGETESPFAEWKVKLRAARLAQGCYYPGGASRTEMDESMRLLRGKTNV
jgi:glycosyltransferase involved in cell wall biosynthesis